MSLAPSARLLLLGAMLLAGGIAGAQERHAYEGVVSWKKQTIGTVILLDVRPEGISGSMRLEKFVPIDGGSIVPDGFEFRSAGSTYRIDNRRGKIVYSGPQGEGDRFIRKLTRLTGRLEELLEETEDSPRIATLEVNGRRRDLAYGRPALWKRSGVPFENFERLEELLGKEISVWVASADLRRGTLIAIEEPDGMDIPLKAPKNSKPKEPQKK